jgi:hypothetical protein
MGDAAEAPGALTLPDTGLEWVDADLTPGEGYTPNRALSDDYRCFVIEPNFTEAVDLIGFDIVPGQRAWVHHDVCGE